MNKGEVESVYVLETAVKTPVGLARADLARPTVIMTNLFTGKPEYELYVFGEKTFVVPISNAKSQKEKAINEAVEEAMGGYIKEYKVEIDRRKIKISIPTRYMRDFTKKVQKNLVKVGRRFGMVVELEQIRENQDFV
jgi:ATPase